MGAIDAGDFANAIAEIQRLERCCATKACCC
jgi:hypothetical protein